MGLSSKIQLGRLITQGHKQLQSRVLSIKEQNPRGTKNPETARRALIHTYKYMNGGTKPKEEEQDGMSVHSPCKAPPSSASSLPKEQAQAELELRLLEALEIYPPVKLQGMHRHFVIYGLMEFLRRSFDRHFSSEEVLQLLDRFYNVEMLKPDDEELELLSHEEDFCLPQSYFVKEES